MIVNLRDDGKSIWVQHQDMQKRATAELTEPCLAYIQSAGRVVLSV
jgi:hypothetical protein